MPNVFVLPFKAEENLSQCVISIINSNKRLLSLVYPSGTSYQDEQTKSYARNLFDELILKNNKKLFDVDLLSSDKKELAWLAIRGVMIDILKKMNNDSRIDNKGFFKALEQSFIDRVEQQINEGIERWLNDDNQSGLYDELSTIIINNNYNSFIIAMDNTTRHFKDNEIGKQHFLKQVQKEINNNDDRLSRLLAKKYGMNATPKTTIERVDNYINLEESNNNKVCACTCAIL